MSAEPTEKPIRLPLWKACAEDMLRDGVQYGNTYKVEYFESALKCERGSMHFGLAISEIRKHLEAHGFYLSGRGQKQEQFVVLQPQCNADVLCQYSRAATEALRRGVILGTQTRLDGLSEAERRRHEKVLEIIATKSVLIRRSKKVHSFLVSNAPKILK